MHVKTLIGAFKKLGLTSNKLVCSFAVIRPFEVFPGSVSIFNTAEWVVASKALASVWRYHLLEMLQTKGHFRFFTTKIVNLYFRNLEPTVSYVLRNSSMSAVS